VQRIYEYHQTHPEPDSAEVEAEDRSAYLQEQADTIARTNTLFTIVSLGIVLVSIIIMLNNYRDTRMLGERLTVAEREMRDAKRIAALKESITSLLDNMPALSFSKDAETGVYLACNQGFAEYAHKESPDGVVGLTDAEIFDPETAKHFMEDDRMALSMDEPYTFFEDVPDAAGNQKQFRTTKLKYIDTAGRLCLLGMCQDVTDLVRAQREHESTKEAYENVRRTGLVYTRIAQALARSYTDLFYVELDTDDFVEYVTDDEFGRLTEARRGEHFFDECKIEAEMYLHPDDRETFVKAMDKQTLLDALDRNKIFILTYRLLAENGSRYTSMRVSRMEDDERVIIIGVSDVDEEMRNRQAVELMEQESLAYTRLSALTGEIICAYIVDPETDRYREYSASMDFENFALPKDGTDFFNVVRRDAHTFNHPDDLERFLSLFTKENVLSEIERSGIFSLSYRLLIEGEPSYVRLKAAMIEEEEGLRLIVGINDVNAQVRQEEEYSKRLAQVQRDAHIDALTGVKNRHSYLDAEDQLDRQIAEHRAPEFAIVILDVNDLKKVNDVEGHKAGDQYLRDARKIICDIFKHSPVFRVGGDEFAVISQGDDYEHIDELLEEMSAHNAEAARTGGIVIACGMAKFDGDSCVAPVFERADLNMYENKSSLKAGNDSE
jgi:diguanylate cyclase (GGDEF)-like protein